VTAIVSDEPLSPSVTTSGPETPLPRWYSPLTAKLHTSVGARSLETWVMCWKTSTLNFLTAPGGTGGSVGSTRSNASKSIPSASASVGAAAVSVPVASVPVGVAATAGAAALPASPPVASATIETITAITATRPTRLVGSDEAADSRCGRQQAWRLAHRASTTVPVTCEITTRARTVFGCPASETR